jgi:hypothetical protein
MANLGQAYNSDDAPEVSYQPLPAGDYPAAIMSDEIKYSGENSKNPGTQYLSLEVEIIDGPGQGKKIFHILNLWNPNETAKKIAVSELGAIQKAVGKKVITSSEELHRIPLIVTLGIQPASGNYEAKNVIKKFKPFGEKAEPKKEEVKSDWKTTGGIVPPPTI